MTFIYNYYTNTFITEVFIFIVVQQLPNHLFEELAMDVYDEVDRRENDSSKICP